MLKPFLAFAAGVVVAAGFTVYMMREPAAPEPAASVAAPIPVVESPAVETPAPAEPVNLAPPAAKPSPAPVERRRERKPARTSDPSPPAKPVEVAQTQQPAPQPAPVVNPVEPPAPAPAPAILQPEKIEPPAPPPPRKVTIPSGTLINVRLAETLNSDKDQAGDTFFATLDQPLVVDELVIAERGARLEGRVVEAQEAGRVKGLSQLSIQLVRLNTRDGQKVAIQTEPFVKSGPASKGSDVAKVGVAAGLGAAIGAIAGGGKGAAIGAAAGGAAGTGGVMATRGKPAQIDVETRIAFKLTDPVTLTERVR
ncbi:MAG TPA: hypothetical protein VFQ79_11260 [Bryobacteraceae bacterium]|nr:hypothetical protein [Bryobacteraceae bacterium]